MTPKLTTLKNGLRIVSDFIPHVETVSLGVWIGVGSRHETLEVNGIGHFLEHMAFKGTHKRTALQIAEEIENVGGYLNAYTGRENTAYYARILKKDVSLSIDVLSDILQHSIFDSVEFHKEQFVILQEIGQAHDTPDDIVFDCFQETCYPDQPMGWPILGYSKIIESLTPQIVKDYMIRHYCPQRMVFSAAGNIEHEFLVEQVERCFSSFEKKEPVTIQPALYKGGEYRQLKDLEQVHLVLGFKGFSYHHEDYYTLSVLSTLLGSGMSSRLFQEVREKRGLVYTIYSSVESYLDDGKILIYAGTSEQDVKKLMPVICEQLRELPQTLTIEEINRAKTQLKASLLMGMESTSHRCERLANQILIYGQPLSMHTIIQLIDGVTLEDLSRVSLSVFKSSPTFAALGPIKEVLSYTDLCTHLHS